MADFPLHVRYLLSVSVVFAAITGLLKYRKIDAENRPMVIIWCLLVVNETVRFNLIRIGIYSFLTYNINVLLLNLLYVWQFYNWRLLTKPLFKVLMSVFVTLWFLDFFVFNGLRIHDWRNNFRMAAAFTTVLMAISMVNQLVVSEKRQIWRNHIFIICIGLIIYYSYRLIIDGMRIKDLTLYFVELREVFNLLILQLYYLLMFIASLWIPKKKHFILPS